MTGWCRVWEKCKNKDDFLECENCTRLFEHDDLHDNFEPIEAGEQTE